jgi:hypothetical protein
MTDLTTLPPMGPLWTIQTDGSAVLGGDGTPVPVPSGQSITLQDVIWNAPGPDGLTLRFRFIAPGIAKAAPTVDFETAIEDMRALCNDFALTRMADFGPVPAQIVISLSDVPVAFGEAAPDATQFFEAYKVEDGQCVWEIY